MKKSTKWLIVILTLNVIGIVAIMLTLTWVFSLNQANSFNIKYMAYSFLLSFVFTLCIDVFIFFYVKGKKNPTAVARDGRFGSRHIQTKKEMQKNYCTMTLSELETKDTSSGILVNVELNKKNEIVITQISGTHALVNGTTRSGKTQCYVQPQIQVWAHSALKPSFVAIDPKGELYETNSKLLKEKGYEVMILNLAHPFESKRYNPLYSIQESYKEYLVLKNKKFDKEKQLQEYLDNEKEVLKLKEDVSYKLVDLVKILIPTGTDTQAFWNEKAQNFLKGLIYARLEDMEFENEESQKDITFSQIYSIITKTQEELGDYILNRPDTSDAKIALAETIQNKAQQMTGSIIGSATKILEQLNEEGIKYLTSSQEFEWDNVGTKPIAFFIIIPDENKSRNILATLFITQLYKLLIAKARTLPNNRFESPFYFLLEEFGTSETITDIPTWINISGGRNIWFILILQELSQLHNKYRDEETAILAGCSLKHYILASEKNTLQYFSDLIGKTTKVQTSTSVDKQGQVSSSNESEINEELVTIEKLKELPFEQGYFVFGRDNPCHSNLLAIYRDNWNKGCMNKEEIAFHPIADTFFVYDINKARTINNSTQNQINNNSAQNQINNKTQEKIESLQQNKETINTLPNAQEIKEDLIKGIIDCLLKIQYLPNTDLFKMLVKTLEKNDYQKFITTLQMFLQNQTNNLNPEDEENLSEMENLLNTLQNGGYY